MANLFPSIFPYPQDSPEMKKLGMQTEFEVYTKLGFIYDETVDILCEPKRPKREYVNTMVQGYKDCNLDIKYLKRRLIHYSITF